MKNTKVYQNAILNVVRTILSIVSPLITYPYVSRILGAENLGKVSYTNSLVQYFILLSGLGISTYGIREGAKLRKNKLKEREFISECYLINVIFTFISYAAYCIVLLLYKGKSDYFRLLLIQGLLIFFSTIGIDWVNTIFEDYYFITIRTIIGQTISIALTFLLVNDKNDFFLYAIIPVCTTGIISLMNALHYRDYISFHYIKGERIASHFKPIMIFFANKLSVTLYVQSDTTMLGLMIGDYSVGIYSVAVKIYTIIKNVLAAIYSVFVPRLSYISSENNKELFTKTYSEMISVISLIVMPSVFGLASLSKPIILLLFGKKYINAYMVLIVLSFALAFAIFGGVVSSVFDIVMNREKVVLQSTCLAATSNILLNMFMIPMFKEIGAAITTVIAEFIPFIYCLINTKDIIYYIDKDVLKKNIIHSAIGSVEVFAILCAVKHFIASQLIVCMFGVGICVFVYFLTLLFLRNQFMLKAIYKFKQRVKK